MKIGRFVALCTASVMALTLGSLAAAETIGSPLVSRQFTDIDAGQVDIYVGSTSPFQQSGNATSWSFYDDRNTSGTVTPVIFLVDASGQYTVTGIRTRRVSTAT